jgi:hypothetical protein
MSEQVSFACVADTREQKPQLRELAPHVYGYISDFDPTAASSSATGEGITAGDALRGCFECEEAALRRLLAKRGYQPSTRCSGR